MYKRDYKIPQETEEKVKRDVLRMSIRHKPYENVVMESELSEEQLDAMDYE